MCVCVMGGGAGGRGGGKGGYCIPNVDVLFNNDSQCYVHFINR